MEELREEMEEAEHRSPFMGSGGGRENPDNSSSHRKRLSAVIETDLKWTTVVQCDYSHSENNTV
jgi:hypothetical protein